MTGETSEEKVLDALRDIVEGGLLPSKAAQTARALLTRMTAPVRVVVMGPPGSGKTTLLNVLCGAQLVPDHVQLPTTEIRHGAALQVSVTLGDGSKADLPEPDVAAAEDLDASMVEIRAPLPILKRISLMELVTDGTPDEMAAAAKWAARWADMALWVTPQFGQAERRIWNAMPDTLKGNAFLVMSQVDRHSYERQEMIRQMPQTATGGEFLGMFPVTALQVAVAQEAGVADLAPALKVSGCATLLDAIMKRLRVGRQSDHDAAEYFVLRYGDGALGSTGSAARRGTGPAARARDSEIAAATARPSRSLPAAGGQQRPASRPAGGAARVVSRTIGRGPLVHGDGAPASRSLAAGAGKGAKRPVAANGAGPVSRRLTSETAAPRKGLLAQAAAAPAPSASGPVSLREALAALRSEAAAMLADLDASEEPIIEILSRCADTMEALADMALGTDALEEAVAQAADVVLLLQMERSESAAEDAVCALLQLKRDFEVGLAA